MTSPVQQDEILREIGGLLSDGLPPGWSRATFRWAAMVSGGCLASLAVLDEQGKSVSAGIPRGLNELCGRLKDGMYRPGAGTWFTMTFVLSPDGSYSSGFDYDNEPAAVAGFVPEHYAKEVATFPRDPESTPDWLRATLDRVPNVYAEIYAERGEQCSEGIGPHTGEVARAFDQGGWKAEDGEFSGEFEFTNDWATLRTLSEYGLVRLAGRIGPERWDDLLAFLSGQGWNVGATLYDGDAIIAELDPRPSRE